MRRADLGGRDGHPGSALRARGQELHERPGRDRGRDGLGAGRLGAADQLRHADAGSSLPVRIHRRQRYEYKYKFHQF